MKRRCHMRKRVWMIGLIVSGLGLVGIMAGPLGAVQRSGNPVPDEIILDRVPPAKHRLVAKVLCEEPVSTFLTVLSLHGRRENAVRVVWTDIDGLQTQVEEVLEPGRPLRLSCEDMPVELSQATPVVVHVDSRYPTSGVSLFVIRGSSIQSTDAEYFQSAILER